MDDVKNPSHYEGATVDCMTSMASMLEAGHVIHTGEDADGTMPAAGVYWWGCIFKYVWRWSRKNGLKDLLKARQCIDYLIGEVYGPEALKPRKQVGISAPEWIGKDDTKA